MYKAKNQNAKVDLSGVLMMHTQNNCTALVYFNFWMKPSKKDKCKSFFNGFIETLQCSLTESLSPKLTSQQ